MKINIVGYGVVGKAQGHLLEKLGHQVFPYDPFKIPEKQLEQKVDLTFICTHESVTEEVITNLGANNVTGLYVIKSTVSVGETERLRKKYNIHICYNPEFLRENHSFEDVLNPSRVVIGQCCVKHGSLLQELYESLNKPIYRTDPTTSELVKLTSNSLRAVNISFWNEAYHLCQKLGADIEMLAKADDTGKVLGEWEGGKWGTRFFNEPYRGKCLPKDIKHLINAFVQNGLNPTILDATEKINNEIRKS